MPLDESAGDEIRRFEEQFRRQPDSLVFARLADALRKAGDPERALEVLDEGIRRHADYLSAHIVRARTYRDLGQVDAARSAFERVIELDARNLVAIQGLAEIARDEDDTAAEISWTEQLVLADPQNREPAERLEQLRQRVEPEESVDAEPDRNETAESKAEQETWWTEPAVPGPISAPETDPQDGPDLISELWSGPVIVPAETRQEPSAFSGEEARESDAGGTDEAWWFEPRSEQNAMKTVADGTTDEDEDADLLTRTMAELYARQGLIDEAEAIYRELLRDRPDDETLRDGLDAVLGMRAARGASRSPEPVPSADDVVRADDGITVPREPVVEPEPVAGEKGPEPVSAAEFLIDLLRTGEDLAQRLPEPPAVRPEVRPDEPVTVQADAAETESKAESAADRPVLEEWLRGLRS